MNVALLYLELEKWELESIFSSFPINTIRRERSDGIKLLRASDFQTLKIYRKIVSLILQNSRKPIYEKNRCTLTINFFLFVFFISPIMNCPLSCINLSNSFAGIRPITVSLNILVDCSVTLIIASYIIIITIIVKLSSSI